MKEKFMKIKKSTLIKIGIWGAVAILVIVYLLISYNEYKKAENSPMANCENYHNFETERISIFESVYILSKPVSEQKTYGDTYLVKEDSVTLVYDEEPYNKDDYFAMYGAPETLNLSEEDMYLTITYLEDQTTALEEQATAFYNDKKEEDGCTFTKTDKTTWEDVRVFFYLNADKDHYASSLWSYSPDWYIDVWHYVLENENNDTVTEVLFFERADGFYRMDMCYPEHDKDAKEYIYREFEFIDFKIDEEILDIVQENIVVTETIQADGSLLVTVVNEGDYAVDSLHCDLSTYKGGSATERIENLISKFEENIAPGNSVTFTFDADLIEGMDSYSVDVRVSPGVRYFNDDGTIDS